MSVMCGVFVRQTQIIEMQEVLLFSCSVVENRCLSAAGTENLLNYLDVKQQSVQCVLFSVLPAELVPSRLWPVIMSRGSRSILTAQAM